MLSFRSFVFLDLEATGLPFREPDGKRTRITEICMISVDKEHLLKCDKRNNYFPRVSRKIILPINPGKIISEQATQISGLDNFLLEHEEPFNEKIAAVISSFLKTCTPPLCLIAHNGYKFDFPLLREELKKFKDIVIAADISCSDSKLAFRAVNKIRPQRSENHTVPFPVIPLVEKQPLESNERERSPIRLSEEITEIDLAFNEVAQEIEQLHSSFENNEVIGMDVVQQINETTPKIQQLNNTLYESLKGERRRLFIGKTTSQKGPKVNHSFKLKDVYCSLFGEEFLNQHEAESDVVAMIKCCAKYGQPIVDWFEGHNKNFGDIKPTYNY